MERFRPVRQLVLVEESRSVGGGPPAFGIVEEREQVAPQFPVEQVVQELDGAGAQGRVLASEATIGVVEVVLRVAQPQQAA